MTYLKGITRLRLSLTVVIRVLLPLDRVRVVGQSSLQFTEWLTSLLIGWCPVQRAYWRGSVNGDTLKGRNVTTCLTKRPTWSTDCKYLRGSHRYGAAREKLRDFTLHHVDPHPHKLTCFLLTIDLWFKRKGLLQILEPE